MSTEVAVEQTPDRAPVEETERQHLPDSKTKTSKPSTVQLKRALGGLSYDEQASALAPQNLEAALGERHMVQRQANEQGNQSAIHAAAAHGISASGGPLPHLETIQNAFGAHDVSGVAAHIGGKAAEASDAMGASAYATGNDVAFANAPNLHTAAHEAAHVVQQRAGVSLDGGVGQAGDAYETHADRVADAVVEGRPAEPLLNEMTDEVSSPPQSEVQRREVQRKEGEEGTTSTPEPAQPEPAQPEPTSRDVQVEALGDPVAKQKVIDINAEDAPNCAGLKAPFFAAVNQRLNAAPALGALDAMRDEVRGNQSTYILQGVVLPAGQIAAAEGLTRILDLPSLYDYDYVKPAIKALFPDAQSFVAGAAAGRFNPMTDLDDNKTLRGQVAATWWAPAGPTAGLNLAQMITAFHLVGNTNYEQGVVRLTVTSAGVADMNLEAHKPTAFDGLMQGWDQDPWWVASGDEHWGLTKHGTKEVVLGAAKLSCFPKRELALPTLAPGGAS